MLRDRHDGKLCTSKYLKMNRFVLQKSTKPLKWVLTDTKYGIVVTFDDGRFNDTQKVTMLEDAICPSPQKYAIIMREIGDYALRYHSSKCFSMPYGFEYDEQGQLYLYRRNSPCWRMLLQEHTDPKILASTLRKAAEYLEKGMRQKREIR